MRKFAAITAVLGFAVSSSLAGVVTFEPVPSDANQVPQSALPETVSFNVFVDANDPAFLDSTQGITLIIGSDVLTVEGITYSPEWTTACGAFCQAPVVAGVYASDLFVGGFAGAGVSTQTPPGFNLGVVRIGVPAGLDLGAYAFGVDSIRDGGSSSLGTGDLIDSTVTGTGVVNVVPEPATLGLLALGTLSLIRRRRTA